MTDTLESLITQMTLAEKAALCTGSGPWTTTPVERLGIPGLFVADGPHGLRRVVSSAALAQKGLPATCFPTASSLAATWDTELIAEMGRALGQEAIALGVDVVLGPGVNMKRTPLCGRNFEYFSEDPYLAGTLATALIDGIQSQGVGTSLKHFAANNQEFERFSIDAQIDERALHEIYLRAFEMAVTTARPWTVMCSYNRVNGIHASQNRHLLTDILREQWGFEGFVVSDWGAVHDRVAALEAGLDLEMPGPKPRRVQDVIDAVESGALDEAVLDQAVGRILRVAFRAAETPKGGSFDTAAHHALASRVAAAGMVLLKNDGLLPLRDVATVAVIGRAAVEPHFQGGGSSHITPTRVDVPLDELRVLAPDTVFSHATGYPADDSSQPALIDEAVALARANDVALLFIALPSYKESEGYDRTDLDLTAQQVALIQAVTAAQPRTAVILNNGSAVAMSEWIDGAAAVLEAWMMGQAGGGAIADVLLGRANPGGKLAETFPLRLSDTPAHLNFPGENGLVRYGEGLFIGYRGYDARDTPVLFPFGYGLSYTTFAYSAPRLSTDACVDVSGLTVSVDVTNTGQMAGTEIVQVYVHDQQARLARPVKELKGFAKIYLEPGETQTVTVPLGFRAFAYYDPAYKEWVTEDGLFDILVGASAADIRGRATVSLQSTLALPSILHDGCTMRQWVEDPRGAAVLNQFFGELMAQGGGLLGSSPADDGGFGDIGIDTMRMLMDMPLLSILHFQEHALEVSPEEKIAALLREVRG